MSHSIIEKISIIIPVYNVKEYLAQCIDSVLNQSYENIEVLIVDDGSTDGSSQLCDMYGERDSRVKVLRQENKGVVAARNLGIENASGKYIGFIDADDWIDKEMYAVLISEIGECDVVSTGYKKYYFENENEVQYFDAIPEGRYEGRDKMEFIWSNMICYMGTERKGVYSYLWNKLFRRDIILRFYKNLNTKIRYSEDAAFLYNFLLNANSVAVVHKAFYHHRIRHGSAVYSYDKYFLSNVNEFYVSVEELFSKHYLKENLISQLEKKTIQLLNEGIQYKMGFSEGLNFKYVLPFQEELVNKTVILYGAGRVGVEYYKQLKKIPNCKIIHWVDKNYKNIKQHNINVESIEIVKDAEFDYLLIAIEKEVVVRTVKEELEKYNVKKNQILWKNPVVDFP